MKTILLRDLCFTDQKTINHINDKPFCLDSHTARSMLRGDVGDWCLKHGIEPAVESYKDMATWSLRVRVYAMVPDSLATYYLLRWGTPTREDIHT